MPLSQTNCQHRKQKLIDSTNVDLIVISNPRHILYFCGYWVSPLTLGGWGAPHLLIDTSTGYTTLLIYDFAPNTDKAFVDEVHTWNWYNGQSKATLMFPQSVQELTGKLHGKIGMESGWFPANSVTDQITDITSIIHTMRRRKDSDEIGMIRNAIKAIEAGHRAARETIRAGITELDVYNAINAAIIKEAQIPIQPLGDYASGERAFRGGGPPTERTLQAGDMMILDLFPIIGGYRADFTATVAVNTTLTDEQQQLETAIHAALHAGEAQLKPSARASDVYHAVKSTFDEHGYAGAFPHHAGHGIGLGHPEAPFFVPDTDEILEIGDVVTLEPGAYGANFGARIEHNYLITGDGFERLTNHETRFVG